MDLREVFCANRSPQRAVAALCGVCAAAPPCERWCFCCGAGGRLGEWERRRHVVDGGRGQRCAVRVVLHARTHARLLRERGFNLSDAYGLHVRPCVMWLEWMSFRYLTGAAVAIATVQQQDSESTGSIMDELKKHRGAVEWVHIISPSGHEVVDAFARTELTISLRKRRSSTAIRVDDGDDAAAGVVLPSRLTLAKRCIARHTAIFDGVHAVTLSAPDSSLAAGLLLTVGGVPHVNCWVDEPESSSDSTPRGTRALHTLLAYARFDPAEASTLATAFEEASRCVREALPLSASTGGPMVLARSRTLVALKPTLRQDRVLTTTTKTANITVQPRGPAPDAHSHFVAVNMVADRLHLLSAVKSHILACNGTPSSSPSTADGRRQSVLFLPARGANGAFLRGSGRRTLVQAACTLDGAIRDRFPGGYLGVHFNMVLPDTIGADGDNTDDGDTKLQAAFECVLLRRIQRHMEFSGHSHPVNLQKAPASAQLQATTEQERLVIAVHGVFTPEILHLLEQNVHPNCAVVWIPCNDADNSVQMSKPPAPPLEQWDAVTEVRENQSSSTSRLHVVECLPLSRDEFVRICVTAAGVHELRSEQTAVAVAVIAVPEGIRKLADMVCGGDHPAASNLATPLCAQLLGNVLRQRVGAAVSTATAAANSSVTGGGAAAIDEASVDGSYLLSAKALKLAAEAFQDAARSLIPRLAKDAAPAGTIDQSFASSGDRLSAKAQQRLLSKLGEPWSRSRVLSMLAQEVCRDSDTSVAVRRKQLVGYFSLVAAVCVTSPIASAFGSGSAVPSTWLRSNETSLPLSLLKMLWRAEFVRGVGALTKVGFLDLVANESTASSANALSRCSVCVPSAVHSWFVRAGRLFLPRGCTPSAARVEAATTPAAASGASRSAGSSSGSGTSSSLDQAIVRAYKIALYQKPWAVGPDDGYFFPRIALHLLRSGAPSRAVVELNLNFDWLAASVRSSAGLVETLGCLQQSSEELAGKLHGAPPIDTDQVAAQETTLVFAWLCSSLRSAESSFPAFLHSSGDRSSSAASAGDGGSRLKVRRWLADAIVNAGRPVEFGTSSTPSSFVEVAVDHLLGAADAELASHQVALAQEVASSDVEQKEAEGSVQITPRENAAAGEVNDEGTVAVVDDRPRPAQPKPAQANASTENNLATSLATHDERTTADVATDRIPRSVNPARTSTRSVQPAVRAQPPSAKPEAEAVSVNHATLEGAAPERDAVRSSAATTTATAQVGVVESPLNRNSGGAASSASSSADNARQTRPTGIEEAPSTSETERLAEEEHAAVLLQAVARRKIASDLARLRAEQRSMEVEAAVSVQRIARGHRDRVAAKQVRVLTVVGVWGLFVSGCLYRSTPGISDDACCR